MLTKLLPNPSRRQINLLKVLEEHNGKKWMTKYEIAEKLNCSYKILETDVDHIEEKADYIKFTWARDAMDVSIDPNKGVQAYYRREFKESKVIRMLEVLFFYPKIDIYELAKRTDSSTSTMYRNIAAANKVLSEQYQISISRQPFEIIGDEAEIRSFYHAFFMEKYTVQEWPFEDIDYHTVFNLVDTLLSKSAFELNMFRTRNSTIQLAVNLTRLKTNKYYHSEDAKIKDKNRKMFDLISGSLDPLLNKYNIEINDRTLLDLLYPYTNVNCLLSERQMFDLKSSEKYIYNSYEFLKQFIRQTTEKFSLEVVDENSLILELHNAAYLNNINNTSQTFFTENTNTLINYVKELNPEFDQYLQEELSKYLELMTSETKDSKVRVMKEAVYVHWEGLIEALLKRQGEVSILVVSDNERYHGEAVKSVLKSELPDRVSFEVYKERELDLELIKKSEHEIIVSTFPLKKLEGKEVIFVEGFPTFKEIQLVYKAVHGRLDSK